jgi:hypothetical protein
MAQAPGAVTRARSPLNRSLSERELSARLERLYVATVAVALACAGGAIGFFVGVVPYFRLTIDVSRYDGFFLACVVIGAVAGAIVGLAFGARWYRTTEASPLVQRRMLAYVRRKNLDGRFGAQRTMANVSLRNLIGGAKNAS